MTHLQLGAIIWVLHERYRNLLLVQGHRGQALGRLPGRMQTSVSFEKQQPNNGAMASPLCFKVSQESMTVSFCSSENLEGRAYLGISSSACSGLAIISLAC